MNGDPVTDGQLQISKSSNLEIFKIFPNDRLNKFENRKDWLLFIGHSVIMHL